MNWIENEFELNWIENELELNWIGNEFELNWIQLKTNWNRIEIDLNWNQIEMNVKRIYKGKFNFDLNLKWRLKLFLKQIWNDFIKFVLKRKSMKYNIYIYITYIMPE